MIISIGTEKDFDKIHYPFMIKIKNLQEVGIELTYFNIIKVICNKPTANIFHGEKLKSFPLRSGK